MGFLVGQDELMQSHARVGMIISDCADLESELAYLNWQLVAFEWDKKNPHSDRDERQAALNAERSKKKWSRNTPLSDRLEEIAKAFDAQSIKDRETEDPEIEQLHQRWAALASRLKLLADKRNDLCHSSLYWNAGKLKRDFGKLWGGSFETSEAAENDLLRQCGDLMAEVGDLTTTLGFALPFADGNLRISVTASL